MNLINVVLNSYEVVTTVMYIETSVLSMCMAVLLIMSILLD